MTKPQEHNNWKPGLPRGKVTQKMLDEYEVYFSPMGQKWHRKKEKPMTENTTLTDGSPVTPDHREIDPATGQQKGYVVLSEEERAKGFVRPLRDSYVHNTCGQVTKMGRAIAETYAREPGFYSGTFCVSCCNHFPLDQFVWAGTTDRVGS